MLGNVFDAAGDNVRVLVWGVQWMQQTLPARASSSQWLCCSQKSRKGAREGFRKARWVHGRSEEGWAVCPQQAQCTIKIQVRRWKKGLLGGEGPYRHHAVALRLS